MNVYLDIGVVVDSVLAVGELLLPPSEHLWVTLLLLGRWGAELDLSKVKSGYSSPSNNSTVPHYYCTTLPLYHATIVPHSHCTTLPLYHIMYHTATHSCFTRLVKC